MNKKKNTISVILMLSVILIIGSCTRSQVEEPSPLGPSTISVIFEVTSDSNVLTAGPGRDSTMITASLKKYDGTPFPGKTIVFEIRDSSGLKTSHAYDGFFPGEKHAVTRVTDSQGIAQVKYYGPNARELLEYGTSREIYIYGYASWSGQEYLIDRTKILIVLTE
ncbi:MAG: hypothetical protein GF421_08505 [Candidatus Aminicenantes bacterium]|nr:hypothetical protein [Candidatus Aminicenantes bacterium]